LSLAADRAPARGALGLCRPDGRFTSRTAPPGHTAGGRRLHRVRGERLREPSTAHDEGLPIARDLISLTPPVERAMLVGAPLKRSSDKRFVDEHLQELERL